MWLTLWLTKVLISHFPASIKRCANTPTGSFQGFDSPDFCGENDILPDADSFSNLN